ncbi:tRNA lysidine(34) synthetase TilS [Paraliobacillus zengyii]|uniref:tRNA lysidine(34) synthetase TilS n=1 Tax=Paraliobacillus zengyii TaxID=2213194 RepID=UPI000DD2FCD6|nr:tRNA lysidine(34) synthetase TilS [Paraliobacillus zengyii]
MFKQEVDTFIKRYALFKPHSTLLIGVSGGPDSMALLHYLNVIKKAWDFQLIVVSVDHGLRGEESKVDVDYVSAFCAEKNIAFYRTALDVPSFKKEHKLGTQEAARNMRYRFFADQMDQHKADYLVLGHHGDDQIETVLMRLTRTANPSSLAGIPVKRPFADGELVRPLLSVTKEEIESYCQENGIIPRRDPSNEEDVYTRNFFRIHLLPLLKKQNPNLHRSVRKLSESIRADNAYMNEQAEKVMDEIVQLSNEEKQVTCSIKLLKKHPFALQRRIFHLILSHLYDVLPNGLHFGHEEQFFDLIHSERANVTIDLPKDLQITKSYQTLYFHFREEEIACFSAYLSVPSQVYLPTGAVVSASFVTAPTVQEDKNRLFIPISDIEQDVHLTVRYRQDGDRMYVKGLDGRKKIKDIFIDKKIPLHKRNTWPLIVDQQGNVLWVIGLTKGAVKGYSGGSQFIQIEYRSNEKI